MKINYLLLILSLMAVRLHAQDTPAEAIPALPSRAAPASAADARTNKPKAFAVTNAPAAAATNAAEPIDREAFARQLLEQAYVADPNAPASSGAAAKVAGPPAGERPPPFPAAVPGAAVRPATNVVARPKTTAGVTNLAAVAKANLLNAPTNAAGKSMDEVIATGLLKLQKADIDQVLDYYAELIGRTVLRPATLPAPPITIKSQTPLTRREAVQALDSVLALNQITMIPVGEKFVKAVPEAQAPQAGKAFTDTDGEDLPEAGQFITQIVQLTVARPSEVIPAITPLAKLANNIIPIDSSMILILRDYSENIKRMLEIIKKVDVVVPQEYEPVVIPIKYALASDIQQVLASLTPSGAGPSVGRQQGGGVGGAGAPGGAGRAGGGLQGLGGQGSINPQTGQPYPGTGTGTGLGGQGGSRNAFQNRLQSIVNRVASGAGQGDIQVLGQTKIIADERTNSLLVFATKQDLQSITNIIAKLDIVLAQVLIETIIMDVSLDNSLSYGVSAAQSPKQFTPNFKGAGGVNNSQKFYDFVGASSNTFTGVLPPGFSYFGKIGESWNVTVQAITSDSRINVIQKPRIQTSHATPASVFIGNTVPYVTSTYSGGGFGGGPSSQYQQLRVGIQLSVTPFINTEGLVVMKISESIDEISGSTPIEGVGAVPNTSSRTFDAEVAVRDGETIVLGGFMRNSENKGRSGVPILKDIPLLGSLFSSHTSSKERKELIVLMHPTVLPTPESASITATAQREQSPAFRRAERDEEEYTRTQDEKARREEKRHKE